jgi:glutamine synthetase
MASQINGVPPRHHPTHSNIEHLKSIGIHTIRLTWVDLTNVTRFRAIDIGYFITLINSSQPGVSLPFAFVGNSFAPGYSQTGEYLYVPDLTTFRLCPYAPGHASVMGWFQEKLPITGPDGNLALEAPLCPRTTLARIVK